MRLSQKMNAPVTASICLVAAIAVAQQPAATPDDSASLLQQKVAAIKQSTAENQAALRQYQWTETTQVAMKGEVKSTTQKTCYYGNDGKIVKVPIASPQPQEQERSGGRRSRLKEKVIEKKTEELTDYVQQATALIHEYVPPSPDKMQSAVQSGNVLINPSAGPGVTSLIFKDYRLPGDSMTFSISQSDKKMTNLIVKTYLNDPEDAVTMNVAFATLADGTSYPGQTVLNLAKKEMRITVSNSNYRKTGN